MFDYWPCNSILIFQCHFIPCARWSEDSVRLGRGSVHTNKQKVNNTPGVLNSVINLCLSQGHLSWDSDRLTGYQNVIFVGNSCFFPSYIKKNAILTSHLNRHHLNDRIIIRLRLTDYCEYIYTHPKKGRGLIWFSAVPEIKIEVVSFPCWDICLSLKSPNCVKFLLINDNLK